MDQAHLMTPGDIQSQLRDIPRLPRMAFQFAARIRRGSLDVTLPDGRQFRFGGAEPGPVARMDIRDFRFAQRLIRGGDIGIAESFLRGEWDTPDLTEFLHLFCVNHDLIKTMLDKNPLMRMAQMMGHWLRRNTKKRSRKNILAHYDIGNTFYDKWLDESMTYSSALFEEPDTDLVKAQETKYRRLAEAIELSHGQRVLEIGCGWGGFAEFAAKNFDARVVGLTISEQQLEYARQRMFENGLNDKVEIRYQDYRDERGQYDRIASIEMIEAVGEQYWPTYFAQLRDRLLPGGMAGIQAITIQDNIFSTYRREVDFIQKYVFPGGMLPSPSVMREMGERFGIPVIGERIFGKDYARTLAIWRTNFRKAWPDLLKQGFDERFRRLWEYYLSYCEAGFLSGNIDVRQVVFARKD